MKFVIFSPGGNCDQYVANNILSVASQTYKNFTHIVVDDATTDNTSQIINNLKYDNLLVYRNKNNLGWLANAVKYLDEHVTDDCIVLSLDLDDWLAHNRVLEYIKNIYEETQAWITYGSLITCHGNCKYEWEPNHKYDDNAWKDRHFRGRLNYFSHLRTFRGFLWNKINKNDLKFHGQFGKFSSDVAYSLPILDMTPSHRVVHLNDPLYFYNFINPRNDSKINAMEQRRQGDYFRGLPAYQQLEDNLEKHIIKTEKLKKKERKIKEEIKGDPYASRIRI